MKDVLVYRIYPMPTGTDFFKNDLSTSVQVEALFDYCQIFEAMIFKAGWEHLIDVFGYDKLFEINQKSGWHDCQDINEFIGIVRLEMDADNNPLSR